MKVLNACLIASPHTNLDVFRQVTSGLDGLTVTVETDMEKVVDALHTGRFHLLMIDLDLSKEDFKKISRLTERVFSDIATVELDLSQPHYIQYKLHMMLSKWKDAQSDGSTIFIDNPDLH